MISIFVMYSPDRKKAFEMMLSFLERMDLYQECQKTLVVDGHSNIAPDGWQIIQVPRLEGKFSWSKMWDAGVFTARFPIVWYLDSDRLLPKNYLKDILDNIQDNAFLFTSNHYMMLKDDPSLCFPFIDETNRGGILLDDKFIGKIKIDPRFHHPVDGPGKNVMSGNTAFKKETFEKLGGVDPWYEGHGAFADTDFHRQAALFGCKFIDLKSIEFHYFHEKKDDKDNVMATEELGRLSLDNFIYYCIKWDLSLSLCDDFANDIGIKNPQLYVKRRIREVSL